MQAKSRNVEPSLTGKKRRRHALSLFLVRRERVEEHPAQLDRQEATTSCFVVVSCSSRKGGRAQGLSRRPGWMCQWLEGIGWVAVRSGTYVHDRDRLLAGRTEVLDHVLDEHGALDNLTLCGEESVQFEEQMRPGVEDVPVTISTPRWIHALTVRHPILPL